MIPFESTLTSGVVTVVVGTASEERVDEAMEAHEIERAEEEENLRARAAAALP